ncbi:MAG: hypothetical protein JO372_14410 [Solirubrobacterales bacterium]|nr:hypothetical protein [Solirubrobacterales bacterium]
MKTVRSKRTRALVGASMVMFMGGAQVASAATPSGKEIARTVRSLSAKYRLSSTIFGSGSLGAR